MIEIDKDQPNLSNNLDNPTTSTATNTNNIYESTSRAAKKSKKRDRSPSNLTSGTLLKINETNQVQTLNSSPQQLTATTSTVSIKKEKQKPETWNKIEQQIFFNALGQTGKNFESLTQYFNARQKRYKLDTNSDGALPCTQRSKEQIRHFYYRTWHKVAKYVTIPLIKENAATSDATTTNQQTNSIASNYTIIIDNLPLRDIQVKCLIAYNTLMNKSHRWNKKTALKLVELVNHGWTTVREKGKINRLRMPICKLSSGKNHNEETNCKTKQSDSKKVPQNDTENDAFNNNNQNNLNNNNNNFDNVNSNNNDLNNQYQNNGQTLNIILEPQNESAYCRVHKLAQNPFLSIDVLPNQTLSFLIQYLEQKWKSRKNQFVSTYFLS
jgi:hypothetical protein